MSDRASTARFSDRELVEAVRAGDRAAEFELDRRWRPRLVKLARTIVRDDDRAEEAAQIALWKACRRIGDYDPSRPFEPWILKIGGNCARDLQRRERRHAVSAGGELPDVPGDAPPPQEKAAAAAEIEALRACLDGLTERSRTVAVLYGIDWSLREIGLLLHEPKSTVQGWLQNALDQLRRCMADKGLP